MSTLGNILWFLLIGLWTGLCLCVFALLWCITIIGIPVGVQVFKIARLAFCPFGKEVVYGNRVSSFIINIFWLIFGGLESAIGFVLAGAICCVTIIGIPFGLQCFKLAKLTLMPFGATIQ